MGYCMSGHTVDTGLGITPAQMTILKEKVLAEQREKAARDARHRERVRLGISQKALKAAGVAKVDYAATQARYQAELNARVVAAAEERKRSIAANVQAAKEKAAAEAGARADAARAAAFQREQAAADAKTAREQRALDAEAESRLRAQEREDAARYAAEERQLAEEQLAYERQLLAETGRGANGTAAPVLFGGGGGGGLPSYRDTTLQPVAPAGFDMGKILPIAAGAALLFLGS